MKSIKYHTVVTVPKLNRKIIEIVKMDTPFTHICMISHFLGLVHAFQ